MTDNIPQAPVPSFAAAFAAPEKIGPPKSLMVYGESGTHKTTMFGELVTAGRFNRALVFDINDGTEVYSTDPDLARAMNEGRLTVVQIDKLDPNAFQVIEQYLLEAAGVYRDPQTFKLYPHPDIPNWGYDLVVLDTFNEMFEIAHDHFQTTTYNDKGQLDGFKAWANLGKWADSIISLYHRTPKFVGGFILHPKMEEQKLGGSVVKPKLSGSFKDSITSIPSLGAYLSWEKNPESGKVELTATVGESDIADSKNRYRLPGTIRDFSLVKFYDELQTRGIVPPVATTQATA